MVLVKRRFTARTEVSTAIGWGQTAREWVAERWREMVEEADGRPHGEPTFDVGRTDHDRQVIPVTVTGMTLITWELADRLDEERPAERRPRSRTPV